MKFSGTTVALLVILAAAYGIFSLAFAAGRMTETTTKRWMLLGISGVLTFVPIAFAFMHMIGSDVALIFQTLLFVDAATVLIAGRYYQRRQMHQ